MSFSAVGQVFDLPAFRQHVARLDLSWARGVCLHHTGTPDLTQRPKGWTIQHMRNLAHFYGEELGWSDGPHLFTDEDQIFGLSPLTSRGVHAVSFNATHIGIEALGDYDEEDPHAGRGAQVWGTTIAATAAIFHAAGWKLDHSTLRFHRDDPRTSKTCPGTRIDKGDILARIRSELERLRASDDRADKLPEPEPFPAWVEQIAPRLDSIDWQTQQIRRLLP